MAFIHHDLTVLYGRGAIMPSGLRVNCHALSMSLKKTCIEEERGGLLQMKVAPSFDLEGPSGLRWGSKPSDVAI